MAHKNSKYKDSYAEEAYGLCLLGYTNIMLAQYFEVNKDTINEWRKKYPDFQKALKMGKIEADTTVAKSLFKNAKGFIDDNGQEHKGDFQSQKFWLMNRQRELWTDKKEIEHSGNLGIDLSALTKEELEEIINSKDED